MDKDSEIGTELPSIVPAGDQAVNVEFGSTIDDAINDRVYALVDALDADRPEWLQEVVPTYRSLLVRYDAFHVDFSTVAESLANRLSSDSADSGDNVQPAGRRVYELPVAYGGEYGPDLGDVAQHNGLSSEEVVDIHSGSAYRVYMIGFAPGFPYLGGMDKRIACPRLQTPRTRVSAGSVGIAESQTGVYPNTSPGGWRIIGRTPVRLFDHQQVPPSVLQPGHFVRFVPVDHADYGELESAVNAGEYAIKSSELAT